MSFSTPLPVKDYVRKPRDAKRLSGSLTKLLDVLIEIRYDLGDPESISPTAREVADLYGCTVGHVKRLLGRLPGAYPDVRFEYDDAGTVRTIRFGYRLAGERDRPACDEAPPPGRTRRRSKAVQPDAPGLPDPVALRAPTPDAGGAPVHPSTGALCASTPGALCASTPVAPGAPALLFKSSKDSEERELTLTTAAPEPELEAAPLPDGGTVEATPTPESDPVETPEARDARVAAHLDAMLEEERGRLRAEVVATMPPTLGKRDAFVRAALLKAVEAGRRDLFPELPETDRAAGPAATPTTAAGPPPEPTPTPAEVIFRLADPTGPEAIARAADALVDEIDEEHSWDFCRGIFEDVAAGAIPRRKAVSIVAAAINPKGVPPGFKNPGDYLCRTFTKLRERRGLPTGKARHAAREARP